MIISDLQYIETVENSEVQGGGGYFSSFSFADGKATSAAIGDIAVALTNTSSVAVPGGASSSSSSTALSANGYNKGKKYNGGKKHNGGKKYKKD